MSQPISSTFGQMHQRSARHSEHDPKHRPHMLTFWSHQDMYQSTISPAEINAFAPRHRKKLATRKDAPIHIYEDVEENEEGSANYDNDHQEFPLSSDQKARIDNDHRPGSYSKQFLLGREMQTSVQQVRRQRHQNKDRLPWSEGSIGEGSHESEVSTRSTHKTLLCSNETLTPLSIPRKTIEGMSSLSQEMVQEFSVASSKRFPLQKSLMASLQENGIVGDRPGRKTGKENIPPGQCRISEKSVGRGDKNGVSWRVESDSRGRKQSIDSAHSLNIRKKIDDFLETIISHPYRESHVKASQAVSVTRAHLNQRHFSSSKDHSSSKERSKVERTHTSIAKTGSLISNKAQKSILAQSPCPHTSVLEANLGFQVAEKDGIINKEANMKEITKKSFKPVRPRKYDRQTIVCIQQDMKNHLQSVNILSNYQRLGDALIHVTLSQSVHRFQLLVDLRLRQAFLESYMRTCINDPSSQTAKLNILGRDTQVLTDKATMYNALIWEVKPLNLRMHNSISSLGSENILQTENNNSKGNTEDSKEIELSLLPRS